jgi:hypothetical protein
VNNNGNDGASGLSDREAWKTIAKVNNYAKNPGFQNGDVIQFKRGHTWSNDQSIGLSVNWGTNKTITLCDYDSGDKPRFNANTFQPINIDEDGSVSFIIRNLDVSGMDWSGDQYSIRINGVNNLTLDGLYMDGHRGASKFPRTSGIFLGRTEGVFEMKNCTLMNFVHKNGPGNWGGLDAHAIYTSYSVAGGKTSGSYKIHDNVIRNVEADCMQLKGIATTTLIYNNQLFNYGENAIDLKNCSDVDIYNNKISKGIGFKNGGTGSAGPGIVTHYKDKNYGPVGENITIRDNHFYDSDAIGVRLLSTSRNVKIIRNVFENVVTGVTVYKTDDLEISDNVFLQSNSGSCSGDDCAAIRVFGNEGSKNVKILYNSIYITSTSNTYGIVFDRHPDSKNAEIKKNIIQMTKNSSNAWPLYVDSASGPLPTVADNTFYNSSHPNRVYWGGDEYKAADQARWRADGHSNELFSDPNFRNPKSGDLTLQENSLCIGSGTGLAYPYNEACVALQPPALYIISN